VVITPNLHTVVLYGCMIFSIALPKERDETPQRIDDGIGFESRFRRSYVKCQKEYIMVV